MKRRPRARLVALAACAAALLSVLVRAGGRPAAEPFPPPSYLSPAPALEAQTFSVAELRATLAPEGTYADLGRFPGLVRDPR